MEARPSDEDLMLRFSGGDAAAFDALYARHRGGVFRYLVRQCRNHAAAEELFQDIWMNLVQARTRYRVEAKFTTYLYTLAHNRLMDHFRRGKGLELVSVDQEEGPAALEIAASSAAQPERVAQSRQQARRLMELLAGLPAAQREVFLMYEEGGLSLEQIAVATGANREAVKSRLRYALAKLRDGMKDHL
jgi:RNA polymerase sigma-70 factor (ECF subfamily)